LIALLGLMMALHGHRVRRPPRNAGAAAVTALLALALVVALSACTARASST
jgi:hypothetical protein